MNMSLGFRFVKFFGSKFNVSSGSKNLVVKNVFRSPSKLFLLQLNNKKLSYYLQCLAKRPSRPLLVMWTLPFISSSTDNTKNGTLRVDLVAQKREIKKAIQESDNLFDSNLFKEAISVLLPHKESGDVEVLWRLCRAQYSLSQRSSTASEDKKQLVLDAYASVSQAMALDGNHWAVHKWMSVALDAKVAHDGVKARISHLEQVKHHMMRATELNPRDAATFYMLGSWCFQIADMPWVQRHISATIFARPPTSSFEEALEYFKKAEDAEPRFYSQNLLMLGKTLLKLNRQSEAVHFLTLARDYIGSSEEDVQVKKEAVEILKGVKVEEGSKN